MSSPFYEGTPFQFAWNSSSLGTLKDCPRKYYLNYVLGWQPKGEGLHLRFGSLYHKGLELFDVYLAEGDDADTALDRVVDYILLETWDDREYEDFDCGPLGSPGVTHQVPVIDTGHPWSSDHPAAGKKNRETLLRSIVWYLDHYADDPTRTVILESGKPALELTFTMEVESLTVRGEPYLFTGHMDRLVHYGDDLFVMDRKTSSSTLGSYYFDKYSPDNQMSLYTYAARVIYGVPVSGVIIDAAQIAVGFTSYARGLTVRSEGQLNEWMADTAFWLRQAERYADENYWPMNDSSCHKYDGCQFRRICSKDPIVRDNFLRTDFIQTREHIDRILE